MTASGSALSRLRGLPEYDESRGYGKGVHPGSAHPTRRAVGGADVVQIPDISR